MVTVRGQKILLITTRLETLQLQILLFECWK